MFDFLFKRRPEASSSTAATVRQPQSAAQEDATRSILARQAASKAAQALTDETSAVAFILQCQFADARLEAAELVHSKPMLEQAVRAMRNADRRVAKLMQSRLDALTHQEARQRQAQARLDQAQRLLDEQLLMPSQVAELDRAWQAIDLPPQAMLDSFEQTRSALRERLQEQAALQRAVIDGLTRLRGVMVGDPLQSGGAQALDMLEQELAAHMAAREAPSLPKNMLSEFTREYLAARQTLAALAVRQEELIVREQADQRIAESSKATEAALPPPAHAAQADTRQSETRQSVLEAVAGMEQALQGGILQTAMEHDKALRAIDLKAALLSEKQTARLAAARGELVRLQGWARWGGNISREELLKAADGMPAQNLAAAELAKKVGSLRERWKSLDVSAGAASKELWERFDAACTTAYAPAAEHFRKLADERQNNSAKALAMIAEARQFAAANDGGAEGDGAAADWKALAAFCMRTTQAWRRLGTIDRKEKKRLDAEFDLAMQALSAPLARQRELEIRRREKLIAQAAALNPNERGALENLRALQERWQEQAKSLPLERADEQQLWQRFRSACDAVFAKRKEGAAAADAERHQNLAAKEALCAQLEAALETGETAIRNALRDGRDGWGRIGHVTRAGEGQIEARFKSAVAALQARLDAAKHAAAAAERDAVRAKLQLCRQLEQALADCIAPESGAEQAWQALPLVAADTERALRERFDAASRALQSDDRHYASVLDRNRAALAQALLRCEMTAGIDSPAELSRERLQLQVEVLQSSFKAGQKPLADDAQLLRLVGLAALADTRTCARIDRLLSLAQNGR